MKLKKLKSVLMAGVIIVVLGIMLSSCKCKVKDETLATIAELRRQERALSSDLTTQQNTVARLTGELASRTAEANDCSSKLEIVKQRLAAWPNIWPDWTPAP
jgi:peptidoglycan hydrolase CwlO-like protein